MEIFVAATISNSTKTYVRRHMDVIADKRTQSVLRIVFVQILKQLAHGRPQIGGSLSVGYIYPRQPPAKPISLLIACNVVSCAGDVCAHRVCSVLRTCHGQNTLCGIRLRGLPAHRLGRHVRQAAAGRHHVQSELREVLRAPPVPLRRLRLRDRQVRVRRHEPRLLQLPDTTALHLITTPVT